MSCKDCPPAEPPKYAVRWRAWFVGMDVYDSLEGFEWEDLPDVGVLGVIVYFADGGKRVCSGDTWYWQYYSDGHWTIAHSREPIEELMEVYGDQPFKRGKWTVEQEMYRVEQAMMSESV